MRTVTVELLIPHRLHRHVLPLGFLGLAALAAITLVLPSDQGATVFWIARLLFVIAYFVLVAVGMSRKRRTAHVHVDSTGLREGATLLAERASIERVVSSRRNDRTTIELRGKHALALELTSSADAEALLDALDPGRDAATVSFLATTTPVYVVALTWIGIPVVLSLPAQLMLGRGLAPATLIAYAVPCVLLWLTASWWFIRRRRVTVSTTELHLPRLFSTRDQIIPLGELTTVVLVDTFTIELRFTAHHPRKLKIYDPALLSDFVDRLRERARVKVVGTIPNS